MGVAYASAEGAGEVERARLHCRRSKFAGDL